MDATSLFFLTLSMLVVVVSSYEDHRNLTYNHSEGVLSRRKRFIVFPDGSSFQLGNRVRLFGREVCLYPEKGCLYSIKTEVDVKNFSLAVFCTQTHGYLQVGDIVWFGTTAALAWELPTDPTLFYLLKDKEKLYGPNRRGDNKHIYYLDESGKVIGKQAYHRKPIVNPAFAKRSIDHPAKSLSNKKRMHDMQKNANYLSSLHKKSIEFHRSGRKSLYVKLEKVLQALGWNGKECVLRMLCETKKPRMEQGTFLEEIIRITFTLPKGRDFESDHHKQYDVAHGSDDCSTLYPACEDIHGLPFYDN